MSVAIDRGGRADQEEQRQRGQVDERRHRLHEVEHRRDEPVEPVGQPGPHPERDADEQRHEHRGEGQREGVHALGPQALQPEEHEPGHGEQRDPAVAEGPGDERDDGDDAEPAEQRDRPAERRLGDQRRRSTFVRASMTSRISLKK